MLPKVPETYRLVYGFALQAAGMSLSKDLMDRFLDDKVEEVFAEFYPEPDRFVRFRSDFHDACKRLVPGVGWTLDEGKLTQGPSCDQSIKDYYENTFIPSIS